KTEEKLSGGSQHHTVLRTAAQPKTCHPPLGLRFGELDQPPAAVRLSQFEQPACLNLADPLAGDSVSARHLIQGSRMAIAQTEAKLNHLPLARSQGTEHLADPLLEQMLIHGTSRMRGRVRIAQEILQRPLAVPSERLVQAHGVAAHDPQ